MFGYLKPERDEMKIREYELYKSVYCGLCRHLGRDYGVISRLTLSYDCTVLAMLVMSLEGGNPCVKEGRCVVYPFKKCLFCDHQGKSFRIAGAVSVIMTYYKLEDSIEDSGFFGRLGAGIARLFFKRSHKKAAKAFPDIETSVQEMMDRQKEAEKSNSGVDSSADPTAKMLSSLCRGLSDDVSTQKILESFGYYLGRWIYLMDAADDLEKDIRKDHYNPFREKLQEDMYSTMIYCNDVLNMTVSQLILAYDLLELREYKEILDNIVYNGLSFQQKYRLFDKRKEKETKKKKKQRDHYEYLSRGDKR